MESTILAPLDATTDQSSKFELNLSSLPRVFHLLGTLSEMEQQVSQGN